MGLIPPFLGGYFGLISLTLMPIIVILVIPQLFKSISIVEVIFIFILLLILIIATFNYVLSLPIGFVNEMFIWSISGLFINILMYLMAREIEFTKFSIFILVFVFLLMFSIVIMNIGDSGIFYVKQMAGDAEDAVATYQGFARSLIFVLLPLVAFYYKNKNVLFLIFVFGLISLFFNGARTEFVLFITSVVSLFLLYGALNLRTLALTMITVLFLVSMGLYFIDLIPNNRMLQLLDMENASSVNVRSDLLQFALSSIADNPLLGDYGAYTIMGGVGSYAHNIFSAWINLGILGFLAYIVMFLILWVFSVKSLLKKNIYTFKYRLFFMFLVFATLALIFAKDYSYMLTGFLVGLFANLKIKGMTHA